MVLCTFVGYFKDLSVKRIILWNGRVQEVFKSAMPLIYIEKENIFSNKAESLPKTRNKKGILFSKKYLKVAI